MAKLIFTDPNHAGRVYQLAVEKATVGRGNQNTLVIADASVSAVHCEILVNGSEVIVRDLGSHNGTFVNGARLTNQQAQLKSGQTVRFGAAEARLELDEPLSDETVSEMTAVRAMQRSVRDQRREENRPKPADPSMKIESPASNADDDRTVTSHKTLQPAKGPVPAVPAPTGSHTETSFRKTAIVIAVALALGLVVILWVWWGRK